MSGGFRGPYILDPFQIITAIHFPSTKYLRVTGIFGFTMDIVREGGDPCAPPAHFISTELGDGNIAFVTPVGFSFVRSPQLINGAVRRKESSKTWVESVSVSGSSRTIPEITGTYGFAAWSLLPAFMVWEVSGSPYTDDDDEPIDSFLDTTSATVRVTANSFITGPACWGTNPGDASGTVGGLYNTDYYGSTVGTETVDLSGLQLIYRGKTFQCVALSASTPLDPDPSNLVKNSLSLLFERDDDA